MQVEMKLESVKKNSVRYNAVKSDPNPCVTSVYVMKTALPQNKAAPETLLLTITLDE